MSAEMYDAFKAKVLRERGRGWSRNPYGDSSPQDVLRELVALYLEKEAPATAQEGDAAR